MGLSKIANNAIEASSQYTGFKNRIINGAMMIDQRNAGASVTPTTNATYTLDRWNFQLSAASKFSTQQSSTAPTGFSSSILVTSLSSYSSGAGGYFGLRQQIEGFNVADLGWGTAGASPVTLSFWVRSSLTGSFGGAIISTGAGNYSYPFLYTVSSANTWTQISISVPANTFNTPSAGNASAVEVCFNLGTGTNYSGTAGAWMSGYRISATGATSVVGTNGATFYITGIQLEKGSTTTSFDYRPYGTELALCQRYYQKYASNTTGNTGDGSFACWANWSTTNAYTGIMFPQMRSAPSGSYSSLANFTYFTGGNVRSITIFDLANAGTNRMELYITASSLTTGSSGFLRVDNGWFALSAEL